MITSLCIVGYVFGVFVVWVHNYKWHDDDQIGACIAAILWPIVVPILILFALLMKFGDWDNINNP